MDFNTAVMKFRMVPTMCYRVSQCLSTSSLLLPLSPVSPKCRLYLRVTSWALAARTSRRWLSKQTAVLRSLVQVYVESVRPTTSLFVDSMLFAGHTTCSCH